MGKKVHASKFDGYDGTAALLGGALTEKYKPLCGAYADDLRLTDEDAEVTCKRCAWIMSGKWESGRPVHGS